jgi:hypothetical protein
MPHAALHVLYRTVNRFPAARLPRAGEAGGI